MSESKVAIEVAEGEFDRFVEAMDLDINPEGWTEEDKRSFADARQQILRAITRGLLVVDADGQPVYTPQIGDVSPITFYEPDGAALLAIDQAKKGHQQEQMFKLLAAMTKQLPVRFSKMKNRDLKVCSAVMGLFLGSR